eukprot:7111315-Pyramimonas_sp.AAC.1
MALGASPWGRPTGWRWTLEMAGGAPLSGVGTVRTIQGLGCPWGVPFGLYRNGSEVCSGPRSTRG